MKEIIRSLAPLGSASLCLLQVACSAEIEAGETGDADAVAVRSEPLLTACSQDQGTSVWFALNGAMELFTHAGGDIGSVQTGGDSSRFDFWFGDHEPATLKGVANVLRSAGTALQTVKIDCGCNLTDQAREEGADESNTVAWVTHGDPDHLLHLCPLFFELDFNEFGPGTILHEATHFVGTEDLQKVCVDGKNWAETARSLALSGSFWARSNADNYRLYALDWDISRPTAFPCP